MALGKNYPYKGTLIERGIFPENARCFYVEQHETKTLKFIIGSTQDTGWFACDACVPMQIAISCGNIVILRQQKIKISGGDA